MSNIQVSPRMSVRVVIGRGLENPYANPLLGGESLFSLIDFLIYALNI
jgi:hypothetical protein